MTEADERALAGLHPLLAEVVRAEVAFTDDPASHAERFDMEARIEASRDAWADAGCPIAAEPDPDAVEVRVAVAASKRPSDVVWVEAQHVDEDGPHVALQSAMMVMRESNGADVTHTCIATIRVPRIVVPEVAGEVERG